MVTRIGLLLGALLLLTGCADQVTFEQAGSMDTVGFFHGLWHGWIVVIAWVFSLFSDSTAIYAIYNNGGWYDFGYVLGVGGFSFSAGIFANKSKD